MCTSIPHRIKHFLGGMTIATTLKSPGTVFGAPFDDPDADVILRSSDKVDFLLYKPILSKASPVFKSMFSLPQPSTNNSQVFRPIIDVAEKSRVLAAVLSVIYPDTLEMAGPLSLDDFIATIATAEKYDMAAALRHLLAEFRDSKALQDGALEVFCTAFSRELGDVARIAARASLKHRLTLNDIGEKLRLTNGPALHALWKYHRACSAAAIKILSERHFEWITKEQIAWRSDLSQHCPCKHCGFHVGPENAISYLIVNISWGNYLDRAREALHKRPCSEAVTQPEILRQTYEDDNLKCGVCKKDICNLSGFSRHLGEEVERVVSKVPLDLPF